MFLSSSFSSVRAFEPLTVKIYQLAKDKPMVDTKLELNPGDYLVIKVEGMGSSIGFTGYPPYDGWWTPLGNPSCVTLPTFLLPNANCWSLIARIGDNYPFQVFTGGTLEIGLSIQQRGHLFLAINQPYPFQNHITSGQWLLRVIRNQFADPPDVKPDPFLDLPWNYESDNIDFKTAALAINSYFDHEYPLLSSGWWLTEPEINNINVTTTTFRGEFRTNFEYSSHDGYDYGTPAGVKLGDAVLAAAAGCAYYHYSTAAGNEIHINHQRDFERYQTRYYHLQPEGLITRETNPAQIVSE